MTINTETIASSQISAADYYLPERRMTLKEMSEISGAPEKIIAEKIGLEEKRVAAPDEQPSDLAVKAGKKILENIDPESIDVLIYCGATPADYPFWVCAHKVQADLKLSRAYVFDLNAICAGTVYAINTAKSLIAADPSVNRVLIAGGEKFSAICGPNTYKNLSALRYADGGGAMLVERGSKFNEILGAHFISRGELHDFVKVPAGGSAVPASPETIADNLHFIQCSDTERLKSIFTETYVESYREIITKSMEKSGLKPGSPDYLVMNQTDSRSSESILKVLGLNNDRTISTRKKLGHIGIVDQIMILRLLHEQKPLRDRDIIVMASSGIGFSWAAVTIKFHKNFLDKE
jgi:3-oxoacyl-[acyl-carrier-protein] synthase-3